MIRAISPSVRPAGETGLRTELGVNPVDGAQRRVERPPVRPGGPGDEGAVDVEQQQHGRSVQRWNDVSRLRHDAKAAITRAAASMSSSETISTGECMYREGTETSPVGTPERLR